MAQPTSQLRIRPYDTPDALDARFMISASNLEPLTVANNRSYFHPLTIAAWIALSCVAVQLLGSWPDSSRGFLGYVLPIPAFASTAVPIMFFFDWINRPYFERATEKALTQTDVVNMKKVYTSSPGSGFYILEYESRVIGILGLDASPPADSPDRVPNRALIRHFYITDPYRESGVQDDMLSHALNQAFSGSSKITSVEGSYSMLNPYIKKAFLEHGFKIATTRRSDLFVSWEIGTAVIQKQDWLERQSQASTKKAKK